MVRAKRIVSDKTAVSEEAVTSVNGTVIDKKTARPLKKKAVPAPAQTDEVEVEPREEAELTESIPGFLNQKL